MGDRIPEKRRGAPLPFVYRKEGRDIGTRESNMPEEGRKGGRDSADIYRENANTRKEPWRAGKKRGRKTSLDLFSVHHIERQKEEGKTTEERK